MRKTGIIFASVLFSTILITSIVPSYSEYISPKKQIELDIFIVE